MKISAPCYSQKDYWQFFQIDFQKKKILDIGSSIGSFRKSKHFNDPLQSLATAKKYITLDINPESKADVIADAHKLPFKDNYFDIILANNVIEHLYDPPTAMKEMYRVLKKDGEIFFTIPFMYPVHEAPNDYVRYTRFGLQHLFRNFRNLEIHERGGFFSTLANLSYKLTGILGKASILAQVVITPFFMLLVKLDKFDKTQAFTRVYFGKMRK